MKISQATNMFGSNINVIVILALLGTAYSQFISRGPCPTDVNVIPDFNVEKYLDTWYEYAKYPNVFQAGGKCVTAQYWLQDDGNVGVKNTMIDKKTGEVDEIIGYATPIENAKLLVTFPTSTGFNSTSNYWVLDTDYNSYSVVYSCQPILQIQHATYVWILARERHPSADLVKKTEDVLMHNGVSLAPLQVTEQSGCP